MPRLNASVPKYRKHKASGQAFVELSGKRHYCGPHGTQTSKYEYDRLYHPDSHKTEHHGRERIIFFGPQGQSILLRYLARDESMYCF